MQVVMAESEKISNLRKSLSKKAEVYSHVKEERDRHSRLKKELATIKQSEWILNLKDIKHERQAKTRAIATRVGSHSRDVSYDSSLE